MTTKIIYSGDTSISVVFDNVVSATINDQVLYLASQVGQEQIPGILDIVPAYRTVAFIFDPLALDVEPFEDHLADLVQQVQESTVTTTGKLYKIPVLYNDTVGLDLQELADYHHLTPQEVIDIHANREYRVYMLGFLPGFAFLGGLDERLHTPRKATPRLEIPAGSISIGGEQTGYYPVVSPGGWQIIGKTPLKMFDINQPKILFQPGDRIEFVPIDQDQFDLLEQTTVNDYFQREVAQ
ncbi:5-oxoprolinase subunit PxpB [Fructobacillus ficulneus]|uniref:Allophanate hydrolase subunit 1 n=1 Tax=Fructobacillus ficulneus TaxID=157463 RepID=A0A0K8MIH9_9LACO|nr:5-oxoprolinase subunit PxpB [Fructobacillus ficulneus]GAP00366.1 allophanate hydrolase subunit 1 [Fructobacillus ficulneus]